MRIENICVTGVSMPKSLHSVVGSIEIHTRFDIIVEFVAVESAEMSVVKCIDSLKWMYYK